MKTGQAEAGAGAASQGEPEGPPAGAPSPSRHLVSNCELAERLIAAYEADTPLAIAPGHELPSVGEVSRSLHLMRQLMFPGYSGEHLDHGTTLYAHVEAQLALLRVCLSGQVYRGLHHRCTERGAECSRCSERATQITDAFMEGLPALRRLLMSDVRAAFEGDPAATGPDEVVFSYPGIQAIATYRFANRLFNLGAVIVPRMMTEQAHAETGIDIHPGATIGESFFIDHGTGVVIGETTVIGSRVRIYQGVTLGALSLPTGKARAQKGRKRHPTIEDEVIIYANATILGGDTVIGRGAVIGGNTWVTESVAAGARIANPCR